MGTNSKPVRTPLCLRNHGTSWTCVCGCCDRPLCWFRALHEERDGESQGRWGPRVWHKSGCCLRRCAGRLPEVARGENPSAAVMGLTFASCLKSTPGPHCLRQTVLFRRSVVCILDGLELRHEAAQQTISELYCRYYFQTLVLDCWCVC